MATKKKAAAKKAAPKKAPVKKAAAPVAKKAAPKKTVPAQKPAKKEAPVENAAAKEAVKLSKAGYKDAFSALHKGQKIRRPSWPKEQYLTIADGNIYHVINAKRKDLYNHNNEDVQATDWQTV